MIRSFQKQDIEKVSQIWLKSNLEAHDFVTPAYWQEKYAEVKELLPQATLYLYEDERGIQGFIGLMGETIAGLFITSASRGQGIGKQLLDHVKKFYNKLDLQVYQKNQRALKFYLRENFQIEKRQLDSDTNEIEYLLCWQK